VFFRKKDFHYYSKKGEQLFASEHYAEARIALSDALERLDRSGLADGADNHIRELFAQAGNHLASRNVDEAVAALGTGNKEKAHEHLLLALELADDVTLREKAEKLNSQLLQSPPREEQVAQDTSCSGCSSSRNTIPATEGITDDFLSNHDRFELLVQTLPADLSNRYMELGESFASSYLLSSEGYHEESLARYLEILENEESDIVLYEAAVQCHHLGKQEECESFLQRAYRLNSSNPLCCIGLVQLYSDASRTDEALALLQTMIASGVEQDQALLLMGDIYRDTNRSDEAIQSYAKVLSGPSARAAAERMIPLFEISGRSEDAKALFKRYLKGCC